MTTKPIRNQMNDPYAKLRTINRRLRELPEKLEEDLAAVRARYEEKLKRLCEEKSRLLTAVKGEEGEAPAPECE